MKDLINQLVTEEKVRKKELVADSEAHRNLCDKLRQEMGVDFWTTNSRTANRH